jgi:A/G-specific adenine glycosylase
MLQRTKAEQVLPVYQNFISKYKTIAEATKAIKDDIREILNPLGLKWRIEKIIELIEKRGILNTIPDNYEDLLELPGVGDYIASAYLSIHKGECRSLIDSNAVRLWGRIFGIQTDSETRKKKEFKKLVELITPAQNHRIFNLGVLDITRKICKSNPQHLICPLKEICIFYKNIGDTKSI